MRNFQPHIIPVYPPNNYVIFEEWFAENYKGCNTDRILMPFFPTSYWVNNDYANDLVAKREAQEYIDSLPNDVKWFIPCQYDDGCLIDWKGKDVLEFNMSKKIGVELPLLCMPHPYKFNGEKKYKVNFVGSRTHPLRDKLEKYKGLEDWYISYERHDVESYCKIMSESIFTLCPRGYGINSFRICEALQYGSIPIYLSDGLNHVIPFDLTFRAIGYAWDEKFLDNLDSYINSIIEHPEWVLQMQENIPKAYKEYYTYEGCFNQIIKSLETEYNSRQKKAESTETIE